MKPIHELLSRIRWDERFGKGEFELAYAERGKSEFARTQFDTIAFGQVNSFSFNALGPDKLYHDIPFHRVREVYKDGALIWKRPDPELKKK